MPSLIIEPQRHKKQLGLAASNLFIYGTAHAVVDAACAALIFSQLSSGRVEAGYFASLVVLYNALAFATQPLIGLAADKYKLPYSTAIIGCVITAAAVFLYTNPLLSIVMAGVGNAMFHVGGGIVSLNLLRGKATAPGLFVAPGALGLMIGTLIGKNQEFSPATFAFLLLWSAASIPLVKQPAIEYNTYSNIKFKPLYTITLLLLSSISIRAFIGSAVNFPWKSNIYLLICLTLAVVLGKGLGGILGDKFGWRRVTDLALVLSAPLVALGDNPLSGIFGMFLFNLTMPVTLTAIANLLPGLPGFAFGMTTLALVTGAFLTYIPFVYLWSNSWIVLCIILISAALLHRGLGWYFNVNSKSKVKKIDINL